MKTKFSIRINCFLFIIPVISLYFVQFCPINYACKISKAEPESWNNCFLEYQIPDSSIVLLSTHDMVIKKNKAKLKVFRRILVTKKSDENLNRIITIDNDFIKTKAIKGRILTTGGIQIKKIQKKDIKKLDGYDSDSFLTDQKIKVAFINHKDVPYILEIETETEFKSLFFWPEWNPQCELPVKEAVYRLERPADIKYTYYAKGINKNPTLSKKGNKIIETWNAGYIPGYLKEDYSPPEFKKQFFIRFAPEEFKLGEYVKKGNSWDSYGKWYSELAKNRYDISDDLKAKLQNMKNQAGSKRELISQIYTLLQNETRYVLVSIDISGWQPDKAANVYTNKYGDCKGLSTLMIGMLKEVGIESHPALTLTRDRGTVIKDFPSVQFNHVIVMVPLEQDTVWLECTSDITSAGELPAGAEGVYCLVMTENGGNLVKTPESTYKDNVNKTSLEGTLRINGILDFNLKISYSGNNKYLIRRYLINNKDKHEIIIKNLFEKNSGNMSISQYAIDNIDNNLEKDVKITINGSIQKFAQSTRSRIILNPNILHRYSINSISRDKQRISPVYYDNPYSFIDSIQIKLPENYSFEGGSPNNEINENFAEYVSNSSFKDGILKFYRKLSIKQKIIIPEMFEAFQKFEIAAAKKDNSSFSFLKK